jgi:hypothetical protein
MNPGPVFSLALGMLAALPLRAEGDTEIDVVVDMTPAGHKIVHPDPAHPAYYLPAMEGMIDPGGSISRAGHCPKPDAVARQLAQALSRQGYLLAHPGLTMNAQKEVTYADGTVVRVPSDPPLDRALDFGHPGNLPLTAAMLESRTGPYADQASAAIGPHRTAAPFAQVLKWVDPVHGAVLQATPELMISIQWGNKLGVPEDVGDTTNKTSMAIAQSMDDRLRDSITLVAGTTFPDGYFDDSVVHAQQAEFIQRARVDRYFVIICAFDFQSCLPGHKKILLWRANMSVPSNLPVTYADMLPLLINAGDAHLGRESEQAEFLTVALPTRAKVTIGTPEVTDDHGAPLSAHQDSRPPDR